MRNKAENMTVLLAQSRFLLHKSAQCILKGPWCLQVENRNRTNNTYGVHTNTRIRPHLKNDGLPTPDNIAYTHTHRRTHNLALRPVHTHARTQPQTCGPSAVPAF